jgi:hypothetical protein|tara:strand:- start:798 stop:1070 length:273 start_codon:yes stop_codon:yes gene_type:complete
MKNKKLYDKLGGNLEDVHMRNKKQYTGDYLSLYDYLGCAAGGVLGQKIAFEATKNNINIKVKTIKNPGYEGKIQMYPEDFLIECTKKQLL